ncbi:MAG: hypothetical protein AAF741_15570 [Bacteroidota bacterium]
MRKIASPLDVRLGVIPILIFGLWLWWANFNARGLFLDEANLARNIAELSWREFFGPLKYDQYAPPLYCLLLKGLGECLGYDEFVLRLPAGIGGLMTIAGLWMGGKRLGLGGWLVVPIAFCFVSPLALRYIGELKPYALDMGIAALLIAWALGKPKPSWWYTPIGIVLIWLSFPAVFSIASAGIYLLLTERKHRLKWLAIGSTWIVGFLALYLVLLKSESTDSNLQNFHNEFFFPWRFWTLEAWIKAGKLSLIPLKHGFGFTVLAQVASGLTIVWLLISSKKSDRPIIALLLGPYLLAVGASVIGKYSLIPRLMLFSFPGLWLLAGWGWRLQQEQLNGYWKWLPPAVVLMMIPATNVMRHYRSPLYVGQVREMLMNLPDDRPAYVDKWAVPAVRYYQEIHRPRLGPNVTFIYCVNGCEVTELEPPYSLLFSMQTSPDVNRRIDLILDELDTDTTTATPHLYFRGQIIEVE